VFCMICVGFGGFDRNYAVFGVGIRQSLANFGALGEFPWLGVCFPKLC